MAWGEVVTPASVVKLEPATEMINADPAGVTHIIDLTKVGDRQAQLAVAAYVEATRRLLRAEQYKQETGSAYETAAVVWRGAQADYDAAVRDRESAEAALEKVLRP